MAKNKEETEIKTDGWKDTFSDLMNLLLCFFILLYSMSSIDEAKYAELVASLSNSVYLAVEKKQLVRVSLFPAVQHS